MFGDEVYLEAALGCGEVVWRRGLLRKGYGLCHGVSGNSYTFIQLFKLTGRQHHLERVIKVCVIVCVCVHCEAIVHRVVFDC